jgi:hypothetical protein
MVVKSLLYAIVLGLSYVSSVAAAPKAPPPPSKDPFYKAPNGFEKAAPGAVLRSRKAIGLPALVTNCSDAYNVLYRTTDSNYNPSWAVTTLLVPKAQSGYPTTKPGSALLSYQIPCKRRFHVPSLQING